MSTKVKIKESKTVIIKRSQVNFAPYNPKKHSEKAIKQQRDNFKRVGFLGGIVWNKVTGNLVSGHKRVMAMDIYYGYDGSKETDYDLKVEQVEFDEKTEKEQNIYMDAKATNTSQDYDLLAGLLPEIDVTLAGLDQNDLNLMTAYNPEIIQDSREALVGDLDQFSEEKKAQVKEAKKAFKDNLNKRDMGSSFVTLSFDNFEHKAEFMSMYGFNPNDTTIKGEVLINRLNQ